MVDTIEKNKDYDEELLLKVSEIVKIFHAELLRIDALAKLLEIDNNLIYEKVIEYLNEYKTFNNLASLPIFELTRIAVLLDKKGYKQAAEEVFFKMLRMIPLNRYKNHIPNRSYLGLLQSERETIIKALYDTDILSVRINGLLKKLFGYHFERLRE